MTFLNKIFYFDIAEKKVCAACYINIFAFITDFQFILIMKTLF